jgi:hypothetical protein
MIFVVTIFPPGTRQQKGLPALLSRQDALSPQEKSPIDQGPPSRTGS